MPRKCLRCIVELSIHAVTCPGVWLPRRDDLYLRITLFNQVRHSLIVAPVFPLLLHEKFTFDKVFYTAFEPSQVADRLQEECVDVELVQLSNGFEGGKLLASHYANARDFLYPYPTYSTNYSARDRQLILDRSIDFPGIQPKVEFASRTIIREASSLDDINLVPILTVRPQSPTFRLSRSRASSPTYCQPTSVSRSMSPSRMGLMPSLRRRLDALDLSQPYDIDDRPPFVVRKQKASASLIGRLPGDPKKTPQYPPLIKSRGRSRSRSQSRNRSRSQSIGDLTTALDDYTVRRRYRSPHLTATGFSDSDDEFGSGYVRARRGRSPSPTLAHRYDVPRPHSPLTSDFALARSHSPYRTHRSVNLDTVDDLARDLEFARSRRYY